MADHDGGNSVRLALKLLDSASGEDRLQRQEPLQPYFDDLLISDPIDLRELVYVDQQQRWSNGRALPVERYLERFPAIGADREFYLDVVYHEYLLCQMYGDDVDLSRYRERFPQLAADLERQIQFHDALENVSSAGDQRPQPAAPGLAADVGAGNAVEPLKTIGRYQLEGLLGTGGMGEVYAAVDTELDRRVAVKLPKVVDSDTERVQARILREARTLAALQHPGVCPIYDFGRHGGQCYLVMPLLAGQTLAQHLKRLGRLPVAESIRIAHTIADAVAAAHKLGIVHRDLKPANIMLDQDSSPIVLDFGLVQTTTVQDVRLTTQGAVVGTPAYLAPERLADPESPATCSADLYSLGVMFYEMLTGRRPHEAKSTAVLFSQILTEPIDPPSRHQPEISPQIDAICLKALEKNPSDRFASMEEFAQQLRNGLSVHRIKDQKSDGMSGQRSPGLLGRSRWITLLVIALIAFCLAVASFYPTPKPTAPFQAQQVWSGNYYFLPAGENGEAELLIENVTDNGIAGRYQTEGGEFVWAFAGQVTGTDFRVALTEALSPSAESVSVVGHATIVGRCNGDRLDATYKDADSEAGLVLLRRN